VVLGPSAAEGAQGARPEDGAGKPIHLAKARQEQRGGKEIAGGQKAEGHRGCDLHRISYKVVEKNVDRPPRS